MTGAELYKHPKYNYQRWRAVVFVKGRRYVLGYADTQEEAHRIYTEKAEKKREEVLYMLSVSPAPPKTRKMGRPRAAA